MTDKLQNSESSLEKYKRMAAKGIAEVALIMVGILGAFAIEDWQDQKKQEKPGGGEQGEHRIWRLDERWRR